MSNAVTNAAALNRLPQSHWDEWYASERTHNRLLDIALSEGKCVIAAADFAAAGVLKAAHIFRHPAYKALSLDAVATVAVNYALAQRES